MPWPSLEPQIFATVLISYFNKGWFAQILGSELIIPNWTRRLCTKIFGTRFNRGPFCKYSWPEAWHAPGKVARPPATATAASPETSNPASPLSDPRPPASVSSGSLDGGPPPTALPRSTGRAEAWERGAESHRDKTVRGGAAADGSGSAFCHPSKDRPPPGFGYWFLLP